MKKILTIGILAIIVIITISVIALIISPPFCTYTLFIPIKANVIEHDVNFTMNEFYDPVYRIGYPEYKEGVGGIVLYSGSKLGVQWTKIKYILGIDQLQTNIVFQSMMPGYVKEGELRLLRPHEYKQFSLIIGEPNAYEETFEITYNLPDEPLFSEYVAKTKNNIDYYMNYMEYDRIDNVWYHYNCIDKISNIDEIGNIIKREIPMSTETRTIKYTITISTPDKWSIFNTPHTTYCAPLM